MGRHCLGSMDGEIDTKPRFPIICCNFGMHGLALMFFFFISQSLFASHGVQKRERKRKESHNMEHT